MSLPRTVTQLDAEPAASARHGSGFVTPTGILSLRTEVTGRPPPSAWRPPAAAFCGAAFGLTGGVRFQAHGTACAFSPGHLGPAAPGLLRAPCHLPAGGQRGAPTRADVPCIPLQHLRDMNVYLWLQPTFRHPRRVDDIKTERNL